MGSCQSQQPQPQSQPTKAATTVIAVTTKIPNNTTNNDDVLLLQTIGSQIFQPVLGHGDADSSSSTATLLRAIIPLVLPIVRKVVSQQLVQDGMVLHNEILVQDLKECPELPVGPLRVHLDAIAILDHATVKRDVDAMPEFDWPEKERMESLIEAALHPKMVDVPSSSSNSNNINDNDNDSNSNSKGDGIRSNDPPSMLVFDISGVHIRACLGPNMELVVPAVESGAMMSALVGKVNLEIGTGGSIQEAWIKIIVPKLRIWFVSDTYKVYVAFMGRPSVLPQLHVNADRGKGDFWHVELTANASAMDDIIESVLCGFGPSSLMTVPEDRTAKPKSQDGDNAKKTETNNSTRVERSWVGSALGRTVSQAIGRFAGVGDNRPLEIDLKETIEDTIETALGKARAVEAIQADILVLQKELKLAQEYEQQQQQQQQQEKGPATGNKHTSHPEPNNNGSVIDGTKGNDSTSSAAILSTNLGSAFLCCGTGST